MTRFFYLSSMEPIIYTDVESLIDLLANGDLPTDALAFRYYKTAQDKLDNKISFIHKTELKDQLVLRNTYSSYMTKRN